MEIETGCLPLVNFFNERGLKTYMSCEGHYPDDSHRSIFWISFDKSVTEDDLFQFMENHTDEYDTFWMRGRFAKRLGFGWVPFTDLCYFATNKEVANMDLKDFIKRENQNV